MKKLFLAILFTLLMLSSFAQDKSFTFTELDTAQAYARAHQSPILMVFAGSDWCRPCMQFKEQILQDSSFEQFAAQHLAILYLDFPAKKRNKLAPDVQTHHEALAKRFNQQGTFPQILLLNAEAQLLTKLTYRRQEAEAFVESIKPFLVKREK